VLVIGLAGRQSSQESVEASQLQLILSLDIRAESKLPVAIRRDSDILRSETRYPASRTMTRALAQHEAAIWYCFCDQLLLNGSREPYLALLSNDERHRYERYYFDKDRRQFLAARVLVRSVLSYYAPVLPEEWEFAYSAKGKPFIAPRFGLPSLRFNHSHTQQLVACALTRDDDVGVDVEWIDRKVNFSIVNYCLSPSELDGFRRLDEQDQRDFLFRHWTLKESYAKARGLGLSLPLSQFSFSFADPSNPTISFGEMSDDDPGNWQFYQCLIDASHYLAVAIHRVANRRSQFVLRRWPAEGTTK
jgi:4'-phosphopantetheinyl transferase